jgi:hypothetical protein
MVSSGNMKKRRGQIPLDAYSELQFTLSKLFIDVDESIQIGIIQNLLNKVFKTKKATLEQDLYNSFLKQLSKHASIKKSSSSDPVLKELFDELNKEYFDDILDQPLLVFGRDATTTLGNYNYAKDKVTISSILKSNRRLMKFVLYHELLHKKHSFTTSPSGRSRYHTKEFRIDEKKFSEREGVDIEKELSKFVQRKRIGGLFKWFP